MAVNWDFEVDRDKRTLDIYPPGAYPDHKGPTGLYKNPALSRLPKTPLLQDYIKDTHAHLHPQVPISIHIPPSHIPLLPQAIRSKMAEDRITSDSVKIFVVGQRLPRISEDLTPSFYAQYGTDPLSPTEGNYNAWRTIDLMLTESDSQQVRLNVIQPENGVSISNERGRDGQIKKSLVRNKSSIVHPGNPDPITHRCPEVVSPVPIGITGLDPRGESFWSYVKYTEGGANKAIATLHFLFSNNQVNKVYDELWGERDNNERNFRRLPSGVHTRSNTEFFTLCQRLQEAPEFNNRGKSFQRLRELLEYHPAVQPVAIPPIRKPAVRSVTSSPERKPPVRPVATPSVRKPASRRGAVPQVKRSTAPTQLKARRTTPSVKNLPKSTKGSVKFLQRKRNLQKKKVHVSRKRKHALLQVKSTKKRVYMRNNSAFNKR
ncbi:MAG: hypothetical protein K2P93_03580 [Alphaproteobacteria bacterium]|nr:hypothetical protein [Alphaproteobacteria bacterium]